MLWPGGRQHYRVESPVYREHVLRLTRLMAERYRNHPALALWHVDNELGCHVPHDYSDDAAQGFRRWLERRYDTVDALNAAWGTAFWSQRFSAFDEVFPPHARPRRSPIRPSSWTSPATPRMRGSSTTGRSGTCCERSPRRCPPRPT